MSGRIEIENEEKSPSNQGPNYTQNSLLNLHDVGQGGIELCISTVHARTPLHISRLRAMFTTTSLARFIPTLVSTESTRMADDLN